MSNGLDFLRRGRTRVGDGFDFGYGDIIRAAGGLAEAGITAAQKDQAASKSAASGAAALATVLAADAAATAANAAALTTKSPADAQAAAVASGAQDKAGAALPADMISKRVDAAQAALNIAIGKWQAASKAKVGETYAKALVDAAQMTVNKASNAQMVRAPDGPKAPDGSWWTSPCIGPVPGWGVTVGVGGIGAAAWRLIRGKWGF